MPKKRRCKKCDADISHRHSGVVCCGGCDPSYHYSLGKTCPTCSKIITNRSTTCTIHHPIGKLERNSEIVQRYLNGEKCAHLAKAYNIARERVRQIIAAAGETTPRKQMGACPTCGKEIVGSFYCGDECRAFRSTCAVCGSPCRYVCCNKHRKVNPWAINQTVTLYESGLSQRQVMETVGTSMFTVYRHLKIAGKGPGKGNGHRTSQYFIANRPESA